MDIAHDACAGFAGNLQAEAGVGDICELDSMKASPLLQGACLTPSERPAVDREHLNHEIVRNRYSFPAFMICPECDSGKTFDKRLRHTGVNLVCDGVPEMESSVE